MVSLLNHRGTTPGKYPPVELLEAFIDRDTDAHWYWEGDFFEDPFSRTPVFHWSESHGLFVVARLLWVAKNGGEQRRRSLVNTCGVYACINPDHWVDDDARKYTLPDGAPADLRERSHEKRMFDDGTWGRQVVSREWVVLVHIIAKDSSYTVCGAPSAGKPAPVKAVITCPECLRDWKKLGRPLVEV